MANETTNATPMPDASSLRNRARIAMEQQGLSIRQTSEVVGIAYQTYAAWLNNSYTGNNARVDDAAEKWLKSLASKQKERELTPIIPGFIMTATANRIFAMLDGAKYGPDIAMIAGDAGVGKTAAVNAYQRQNNNVWLVTARPAMRSPTAILTRIAKELGVRERGAGLDEAIIERLTDTGGLLIVDEAHHLSIQALEELRTLHDLAEIGLAIVGNAPLNDKIDGLGRSKEHAQLFSRIGLRRYIQRPMERDMCAIIAEWNIQDDDVKVAAKGIAQKPGGLRSMSKVLRNATRMARISGNDNITIDDMKRAWGEHITGELPKFRRVAGASAHHKNAGEDA
jgi:DNA transposition AAA+ family ATPase